MTPVNAVLKDYLLVMGLTDAQADTALLLIENRAVLDLLREETTYTTPGYDSECGTCSSDYLHDRDCARARVLRVVVPGWAQKELDLALCDAQNQMANELERRIRQPSAREMEDQSFLDLLSQAIEPPYVTINGTHLRLVGLEEMLEEMLARGTAPEDHIADPEPKP